MPAATHSWCLRARYVYLQLAKGELELPGRLSLSAIKSDTYLVGAINDHVVPREAPDEAARLLGGTVRFPLQRRSHRRDRQPPGPEMLVAGWPVGEGRRACSHAHGRSTRGDADAARWFA